MTYRLSSLHKNYVDFLLTSSIPNHHDYRAGASLLFLFPYYIQIGLAQIFNTLELIIIEDFQLSNDNNLIQPIELMHLTFNLLDKQLSPITSSLLLPQLDLDKYNKMFGYQLTKDIFFKNTVTQFRTIGIVGSDSLYTTQDSLLPRDRLVKFFKEVSFTMDSLDSYINIAVNNNRIEAAAIFCTYFNFPTNLTQQLINKVELWNLNN